MKMTLPLPVNLGNSRDHWAVQHKRKRAYWLHLDNAQMFRHIPPPPATPFQRAHVRWRWFVWNKLDPDNLMARKKWILDWLTTRGYLADDRECNVTLTDLPQVIDRKHPRVEITVEEIEEAA